MHRPNTIRVLVVDDEAPARQRLTDVLAQDTDVATTLEASDGRAAVRSIREERPDLVFLDMQMPELNGIDVIEEVGAERMPLTVFVTAFDQHAIRAFESNAIDYLLKPFGDARLASALERAKSRLSDTRAGDFGRSVLQMLETAARPERRLDRFVVKARGATHLIRAADIDWIEAAGVYVTLHVGGKEHLYRAPLHELADQLDPMLFVRVHRSAIVNVESIVQLLPTSHGEFEVVFKSGSRPRISRTYRPLLEKRLGQSL